MMQLASLLARRRHGIHQDIEADYAWESYKGMPEEERRSLVRHWEEQIKAIDCVQSGVIHWLSVYLTIAAEDVTEDA